MDIIDTSKIKNLALITHSYAMLRGYRVCVGQDKVRAKKMLGSSYTEFLVWDHIEVEACSIEFSQLFQLGLLQVMPEILLPEEDHMAKHSRFKQPGILRKQMYGLEEKIAEKSALRKVYRSGPWDQWKRRDRATAFGRKKANLPPPAIRELLDPRQDLETQELNRYRRVVSCFRKPRFQLVMLIALLSMKTNRLYRDSMVEKLVAIRDGKSC